MSVPQNVFTATPAPPQFAPEPAPVAAAQRKNQKIDAKRRAGTQARHILGSTAQQSPDQLGVGASQSQNTQMQSTGLLVPGNINIHARPIVHNPDGSISTVRSITITDDQGRAVLIPTVIGNRVVSNQDAINYYKQTGQHLGIFANEAAADKYAQSLHNEQAQEYLPKANNAQWVASPSAPQFSAAPHLGKKVGLDQLGGGYLDKIPQMQPPGAPPQEQQTPFTPAQYKAPPKGLEYLAAGLSLLFPGAPIAHAAAGMLQGLNQGAQQGYERKEQQAEQQYNVAQNAAQTDFANKKAAYEAQQARAQVVYQNALNKRSEQIRLLSAGINPRDGKPLPFPAVQSLLPSSVDPKTGKRVQDTSYSGYAQAYNTLAVRAQQMGADEIAKNYAGQASEYTKLAIDDANNRRAMALALYNQQQQNFREDKREAAADAREELREDRADAREATRLSIEQARADRNDATKMLNLSEQATKSLGNFYNEWYKAIHPVQGLVNGQMVTMPNKIHREDIPILGQVFSRIDRDSDPTGLAYWYAQQNGNETAKRLILDRGEASELRRRAQGMPIIEHPFGPQTTPKTSDKFVVGQEYTDAQGKRAKYLGDGKWQENP